MNEITSIFYGQKRVNLSEKELAALNGGFNQKSFALYLYLGSITLVPVLDFMGITSRAMTHNVTIIYFVTSILLLGAAIVGRRRKIQA